MYIRRTAIKSRASGEPYYSHRLVESVRIEQRVHQRTVLNLGRHFEVPREQWAALAQRIEHLVGGQRELVPDGLDVQWEMLAQRLSARVVHAQARTDDAAPTPAADYHRVDINGVEMLRPRSVSVEHVAIEALRQVGLDQKLERLGLSGPQRGAAIGTVIARMVAPGSELFTHRWLGQHSALGELIDYDYEAMGVMQLYRGSDQLLRHKVALEGYLHARERSLFDFDEVLTLYDLTNTYFEGAGRGNANAALGRSKEKRSDCPLVTLALVLDGSGFPKRCEVFAGNASEPATLAQMVGKLVDKHASECAPTVVLDAGLATEDNIAWLVEHHYRYVVVSRKRHREFDPDQAVRVKDDGPLRVEVQRVLNEDTGEVELYCHSTGRENKERGIDNLFAQRFEAALTKLHRGLSTKRTVKRYDKVLERIGRLKEKYSRAARYYEVTVEHDEASVNATAIAWTRITPTDDTYPGVYCLRTNHDTWDESRLWHTYTMLTDLEAVFRSLKSELGLRPIYHHKTDRVSGHLFISVLAYHLVHTIRYQLKACGITLSWEGVRRALRGQDRITVELKRADGATVHVRKSSRAEPRQREIYDALGISSRPGNTEVTIIEPSRRQATV